jgi:integrase
VLFEVIYAGGLRVSDTVPLTWADVVLRGERVQLSITGKRGKVRQVLLPEIVSRSLLSLRSDAGDGDHLFRPVCLSKENYHNAAAAHHPLGPSGPHVLDLAAHHPIPKRRHALRPKNACVASTASLRR